MQSILKLRLNNSLDVLDACFSWWLTENLLQARNKNLSNLTLQHICLLLQYWRQSLLYLLLDKLRKCSPDRLSNSHFNLYLNILLGLNLLIQLVQLYVEFCIFLVQLLVVLNQKFLLALSLSRNWLLYYRSYLLYLLWLLNLLGNRRDAFFICRWSLTLWLFGFFNLFWTVLLSLIAVFLFILFLERTVNCRVL